jgi:hypothetical protein
MKSASVSLTAGWQATPTWVSTEGFISTVRLEHLPTGRVVDRTRFDSGKLVFLDRRDEFPSFERDVLMRLACLLGS